MTTTMVMMMMMMMMMMMVMMGDFIYMSTKGGGLFTEGSGMQLAVQLLGFSVIFGWALFWGFALFVPLRLLHILQIKTEPSEVTSSKIQVSTFSTLFLSRSLIHSSFL
jgi:hypothetical protein